MKRVRAKGVPAVVYALELDELEFFGGEITHDLAESKSKAECDVVVSDCWSDNLSDVVASYTRAACSRGTSADGVSVWDSAGLNRGV